MSRNAFLLALGKASSAILVLRFNTRIRGFGGFTPPFIFIWRTLVAVPGKDPISRPFTLNLI